MTPPPDHRGPVLLLVGLALVALLAVAGGLGERGGRGSGPDPAAPTVTVTVPPDGTKKSRAPKPSSASPGEQTEVPTPTAHVASPREELPGGGRRVFGRDRFLVAYYGTAQTPALGVLGETRPTQMHRRVTRAARPFAGGGERVQVVYELIVTIADAGPGPDGDYSHDIPRAEVERYVDAARRHGALLLLDLQPGRRPFLPVARRWAWALRDPWVGLALDPEWRMGPGQVPARAIGHVRAAEVNRVSAWLDRLTRRHDLPEKLFVLHQFRHEMLPDLERVRDRPRLAEVQHADGFGTREEKRSTYAAIARPRQFTMGLKLFYDEDVRRFRPSEVRRQFPDVRFVSYQ